MCEVPRCDHRTTDDTRMPTFGAGGLASGLHALPLATTVPFEQIGATLTMRRYGVSVTLSSAVAPCVWNDAPLRARLADAGYQRVIERFSLERTGAQLRTLFASWPVGGFARSESAPTRAAR